MPTYDYRCASCGHSYELFQSITARPVKKCPSCGKQTAKRLIGMGAGVIFKGSGFYATDYRSDGYKTAAKADHEKSTSSSTASKSTESKPKDSGSKDKKKK